MRRTRLEIISFPHSQASFIAPKTLPVFVGTDDEEELLCGRCDAVLCSATSAASFKARFGAPFQLLVLCPECETANALPFTLVACSDST